MAFLRRGKTAYGEGRRVPSDKEGGRREKKKEEQWRGLRQGKLENGGEAEAKKRDGNKRQRRRVTEKRGSRVYFEK